MWALRDVLRAHLVGCGVDRESNSRQCPELNAYRLVDAVILASTDTLWLWLFSSEG